VKQTLAIVFSLLLVLGQAMSMPVQPAGAGVAKHDCGCGGRMSCCQHASASLPLAATAPASSQNQIIFAVSVSLVWVLTNTANVQIFPTISPSHFASGASIFARNCIWLI
jgi:hypothetical protein